jgi:NDP-sugar pyrophosphorylase family protein
MSIAIVVLAAGMGSRYGGLKQIDPVGPNGETMLDYSVFDAHRAGFERIVFVIRKDIEQDFREAIGRRFERVMSVDYAFQELADVPPHFVCPAARRKPWGTAHAVLAARHAVDTPFAVINADDFYGAASYRILAHFLRNAADDEKAHYALVGFILRNTLSEHGHVSRGLCSVTEALQVEQIVEHTRIFKKGEEAYFLDDREQAHPLRGDEWVSMNMWGFSPGLFGHLQEGFDRFLQAHGEEEKSEFFIPFAVDDLRAAGRADVQLLPTEAPWFGVTYREDKPAVQAAIQALIADGSYPSPLWSNGNT